MKEPHQLEEGEYCIYLGVWYARPPGTNMIANLAKHTVTVNEGGTLTVSPSILVTDSRNEWHGFLENGIWRQV